MKNRAFLLPLNNGGRIKSNRGPKWDHNFERRAEVAGWCRAEGF